MTRPVPPELSAAIIGERFHLRRQLPYLPSFGAESWFDGSAFGQRLCVWGGDRGVVTVSGMATDTELAHFRRRSIDRFPPVPTQPEMRALLGRQPATERWSIHGEHLGAIGPELQIRGFAQTLAWLTDRADTVWLGDRGLIVLWLGPWFESRDLEDGIERLAHVAAALAERPQPPLLQAIEAGDRERTKHLVHHGADVNEAGPFIDYEGAGFEIWRRQRPLTVALRSVCGELVPFLLDAGASVRTDDDYGLTVAAAAGRVEHVAAMLERGADPNRFAAKRALLPLSAAIRAGHVEAVGELLRHGAEVHRLQGQALRIAEMARDRQVARLLKEALRGPIQSSGRLSMAPVDGGELSLGDETAGGLSPAAGEVEE